MEAKVRSVYQWITDEYEHDNMFLKVITKTDTHVFVRNLHTGKHSYIEIKHFLKNTSIMIRPSVRYEEYPTIDVAKLQSQLKHIVW